MALTSQRSYTLAELAQHTGAQLLGDESHRIVAINTLQKASASELSFLSNPLYQKELAACEAGGVILHPSMVEEFSGNKLVTEDPYYAFAQLTQLFASETTLYEGVHPSVVIGRNSSIDETATIEPNAVIGDGVRIEGQVTIGAGCYIGNNSYIGSGTKIYANVSIYHDVVIGSQSIIHSQVVIGSDGFGFAPKRLPEGGWKKVHQLGGVRIGDEVEIGAGTTIDRGALDDTVIESGVKLDNQIQIAHNVVIGENTAIAGATAIAGSTSIGKRCTIAGAVGIIGHLSIVDDVHITAMTLVTKSIEQPGSYSSGTPLNKTSIWRRNAARFNRLDESFRKIKSKP